MLSLPPVGTHGSELQRGNLQEVCAYGMNAEVGLLVNSSRGIIYASNGEDFAQAAAASAKELQQQMETILHAR